MKMRYVCHQRKKSLNSKFNSKEHSRTFRMKFPKGLKLLPPKQYRCEHKQTQLKSKNIAVSEVITRPQRMFSFFLINVNATIFHLAPYTAYTITSLFYFHHFVSSKNTFLTFALENCHEQADILLTQPHY